MTPSAGPIFAIPGPAAPDTPGEGEPSTPRAVRRGEGGGGVTVLVVEDEEKIRELVRLVLAHGHYAVIAAANALQALQLAGEMPAPPDLLLTDVVMPKMSGRELCDQLRERWPELPVIFISGFSGDALLKMRPSRAHTAFLGKPFTPRQLLEQVQRAVAPVSGP